VLWLLLAVTRNLRKLILSWSGCPSYPQVCATTVRHGLVACFALFLSICALGLFTTALAAQTVTVTNVPNQHYRYGYFPGNCPSGLNVPPGQYPPTNHLERGHTIYNEATGQWVFWAHYDNGSYTLAQVLVATSPDECGPYTVQSEFRPQGYQSRDENIFKDDDGSAYLISASNRYGGANDTMAIFKMTPDYLGIDSSVPPTWLFDHLFREAPAVAKSGGTYFLVTSQAAGWFPSQGGYAASSAMLSGWSALVNLGNSSTWGGQSANIITINGTQATTFVLVLDHLGGNSLRDTGSLWLPLILDNDAQTATLDWYTSWQVDMTTGLLTLPSIVNAALGGTASATSSAPANPPFQANDGIYTTRWQAATTSFPASWTVDLGSPQPIQEVNLSWYMVKGSEPYYKYTIGYSLDGINYTTLDHTDNTLYGFTNDSVNFTARYVKITETGYVCQNGCTFYSPSLMEAQLVEAPQSQNLPVNVTVTPSATTVPCGQTMNVTVTVSGDGTNPTPSGKVTLSSPGYTSDTYGLVNGSASFRIPAYAMDAGYDTITATYIPDPTSAPTYSPAPTTGSSPVITYGFGDCALLSRRQPAVASSFQTGNIPAHGNDGDLSTRWTAVDGTYSQWWRVDLGSVLHLNQVVTNWYSTGGRAYQYTIDISTDDISYTTVVDNTANSTSGTTTDNFCATARYVRVTVTGVIPAGGFAAFWECQVFGTLATPLPPAPTELTATAASTTEIDLSWTDGAATGDYNVYQATADGGPYTGIATGLTSMSYADTSVSSGITYYYVVTAANDGGESPYSNQASATP